MSPSPQNFRARITFYSPLAALPVFHDFIDLSIIIILSVFWCLSAKFDLLAVLAFPPKSLLLDRLTTSKTLLSQSKAKCVCAMLFSSNYSPPPVCDPPRGLLDRPPSRKLRPGFTHFPMVHENRSRNARAGDLPVQQVFSCFFFPLQLFAGWAWRDPSLSLPLSLDR